MDVEGSLVSGEQVVFKTTKHWIAPLADSKWAIVLLLIAVVLTWLQSDDTTGFLGHVNRILSLVNLVLVVGAMGSIIYNVVAWRSAEYYITNRRVLGTEGLVHNRSTDSLLTSVSDVRVNVPFLGRTLGYGNIKILSSSGNAGGDMFTSMRSVNDFKKNLMEQKAGSGALAEARSTTPAAAVAPAAAPAPTSADITKTLGDLAKLRDAGAITAEEYEGKKADLLSRI